MYSVKFHYKRRGEIWVPIIPITLHGKEKKLEVEAYVDSGATYSIFEFEILKDLEIDISDSQRYMFVVGDGSFIPGEVVTIPVQIGEHKFFAQVAFSEKLNVGFNLLGRKSIFEEFQEVIFRENQKEIEFRK
ncbi:hypothetical protein J7K43_08660 [Candidatus Calescamantes bacterium]|nr:hypothetical protein [Candidatus Calescamantes bacterium]